MQVRFWGTRGSVPAPGPRTVKYGGNTSCVEVRTDDGTHIILDCGTGMRELGLHLLGPGRPTSGPLRFHVFIGHSHWDHIQGFPFFVPAFLPDTEINIYAGRGFQRSIEETLAGQMQYSYFPVKLRELRSHIHFTEVEEGYFRVGEVFVETQQLNHTTPTVAYRITCDGATLVYTTDHEPFWTSAGLDFRHPGDQRHVAFLEGADLVIHDAQYIEAEYPQRLGWGHSTIEYATDVAMAAQAGKLALFHHDPVREDAAVEHLEALGRARVAARGSALEVFAAAEGLTLELQGSKPPRDAGPLSALWHRPIAGKRVLLVGGSDAELGLIAEELREDGLILVRAATRMEALESVRDGPPDLVILNAQQPLDGSGAELVGPLRSVSARPNLPVLLLTDSPDPGGPLEGGATDYLARPLSTPMLRCRVRAWLSRSVAEALPAQVGGEVPAAAASSRDAPGPSDEPHLAEAIASVPLFRSFSPDQLDTLAAQAEIRVFAPGAEILRQGSPVDALFAILSGRVRVVEPTDDPLEGELVITELGRGEVFGELGVLIHRPGSATVVAAESTRCLALPAPIFAQWTQTFPDLAVALLQLLAGRIYDTDRKLAHLTPDPLTGLPRRRALYEQYAYLASQARQRGSWVFFSLVDIVNLKSINDRFGYGVGDEVIRTVADALRELARGSDMVVRYGGDEFAVLLVGEQADDADPVAEGVKQKLAELAPMRGLPLRVECTVGNARAAVPPETPDELILKAAEDLQRKSVARQPRGSPPADEAKP